MNLFITGYMKYISFKVRKLSNKSNKSSIMDNMDFSLQQIIKQEKETYEEDFNASFQNPHSFYIDIIVQKEESNNGHDWSFNALKTSFEETCSICGLTFKNRYILLQHNISHLSVMLEPLNITEDPSTEDHESHVKQSKCLKKTTYYKCRHCQKVLPYKAWHRHKTEIHVNKHYECSDCGRSFKCKPYLRKHIRKIHLKVVKSRNNKVENTSDAEDVVCPICSAILKNRICFFIHIRNVHSKERVTCEICGSKLKCFSYYVAHKRRVHYNDGKEHKCDMCHKKFRSSRYLSIHKKNTHNPNKTKKHKVKKVKEEQLDIKIEIEES